MSLTQYLQPPKIANYIREWWGFVAAIAMIVGGPLLYFFDLSNAASITTVVTSALVAAYLVSRVICGHVFRETASEQRLREGEPLDGNLIATLQRDLGGLRRTVQIMFTAAMLLGLLSIVILSWPWVTQAVERLQKPTTRDNVTITSRYISLMQAKGLKFKEAIIRQLIAEHRNTPSKQFVARTAPLKGAEHDISVVLYAVPAVSSASAIAFLNEGGWFREIPVRYDNSNSVQSVLIDIKYAPKGSVIEVLGSVITKDNDEFPEESELFSKDVIALPKEHR